MINEMTKTVQAALRQERSLEIITNHIANASTVGFKTDIHSFDETLRSVITTDHSPGVIQQTGNDLDLALTDGGFFKIGTGRDSRYTRNGNFALNSEGILVTAGGDPVMGEDGPITISGNVIDINPEGEIRVDNELVGKLKIVDFAEKEKLVKQGGSFFSHMDLEPEEIPPERVGVQQGALETSNVVTVVEMTKMIETMRNYESHQKVLQAMDETDQKAINEVGKA